MAQDQAYIDSFASAKTDATRLALLEREDALRHPTAVQALCERAHKLASDDPNQAEESAIAALWLAKALQDDGSEGLAHRSLANVYSYLGRLPEALSEYSTALAIFESLQETHQLAITRSSALPTVTDLLGSEEALNWADKARAFFEKEGDTLRLARLENNLAVIFFRKEQFRRAQRHWRIAYQTLRAIGKTSDQATTLRNLAACSISLNRPAEAKAYYRKARKLCEKHGYNYLIHLIDYNIAYLHYLQGDHYKALSLYSEARRRSRTLSDTYHEALCNLDESEVYIELNLLQEAETVAQLSVTQFQEQGRAYEAAKSLFNLAVVSLRQGQPRLALARLQEAEGAFSGLGNILWPGEVRLLRAQVFFSEGRYYEAGREAQTALTCFEKSHLLRRAGLAGLLLAKTLLGLRSIHQAETFAQNSLQSFEQLGDPDALFQGLFLRGLILDAKGDSDGAISAFQKAESYLLELRERRIVSQMKAPVVEKPLEIYAHLVSLMLPAERHTHLSPELFRLVSSAKARSFADLMAPSEVIIHAASTMRSKLVDQVSSLRQELNWLYRRIDRSELQREAPGPAVLSGLQEESREKEKALARALSHLRTDRSLTASDPERIGVAEVDSVQGYLDKAVLVEFFVSSDVVLAMVISAEKATVFPVTVRSTVLELQRRLWHYLHHFSSHEAVSNRKRSADPVTPILQQLYIELLEPLEAFINTSPLVFAPHDFLYLIPFHALLDGSSYLIERAPISYLPSSGDLVRIGSVEGEGLDSILVVGGHESQSQTFSFLAAEVDEDFMASFSSLSELPGYRPAERASSLHLRAQAALREDNPLFSEIRIGGDVLPLLDLYRGHVLRPVLTIEGEGFSARSPGGFAQVAALWRAFLAAGAKVALIPSGVDSNQVHRQHAALFYRGLSQGMSASVAHQKAILSLKAEGCPLRDWAGMSLIGNPHVRIAGKSA